MIPVCYVFIILFVAQYGENIINYSLLIINKSILSYSISTKYSLEGLSISIIISCITSFILYICLGVIFYGPTCSNIQCNDNIHNNNILCLVCQSSFVSKMNVINHIILGFCIGIQSILGSLLIDIIIKSHSYKLNHQLPLIWLQRFGPFIFAFPVTFYYLLSL